MSGLALVVMIVRAGSSRTSVRNASRLPRLSQPSSKSTRTSASNRPVVFDRAPRPRRRSAAAGRLSSCALFRAAGMFRRLARRAEQIKNKYSSGCGRLRGAYLKVAGGGSACQREPMISVVIPTLNDEDGLAGTLAALVPAAVDGLVREVIVVDGGSTDGTLHIAEAAGTEIVRSEASRGAQLAARAKRARFPWLLFLHA